MMIMPVGLKLKPQASTFLLYLKLTLPENDQVSFNTPRAVVLVLCSTTVVHAPTTASARSLGLLRCKGVPVAITRTVERYGTRRASVSWESSEVAEASRRRAGTRGRQVKPPSSLAGTGSRSVMTGQMRNEKSAPRTALVPFATTPRFTVSALQFSHRH